ncbi:MAG: HRDC domain-containing protein [Gemmatimonadaceae bacterium]|nr:HRDC domain-containing protein [Gemmatimonadaceae bacterium]
MALVYIDSNDSADRFLSEIADAREIAVDTEGASFHRFVDRIYLIQLSTRTTSAIIDPLAVTGLDKLGRLLEDPAVEVAFHDADYDLRLLHQDYGWHPTNIFDTRIASQLIGLKSFGLAALLDQYFSVKLDKQHQRADWSMRPLTEGMLAYAAQDTALLLALKDKLQDELGKLGRLEWAREEFSRLEGTRWQQDDEVEQFFKVKGARDLSRRELALLRELVIWRDEVAKEMDRATFRVVGNEVLLSIARTQPQSPSDLGAIKGMPRGILDRRGQDVLAAVRRGMSVPEDQLPKFPRAQRWDKDAGLDSRVALLKNARDAAATRLSLDPGVLCSRERLEAIARKNPASTGEMLEVPGVRKWHAAEMGESFLGALRSAKS